jgi:drug/metabolite transporter (DMT)-like permease
VSVLAAPHRQDLLGSLLVVGVALCFTTSVILARLVYEAGGDAVTMLAVRYSVSAVVLYLSFRLRGVSPWLSRGQTVRVVAVGVLVASYAYGYLGAIQYIPVSLAVLLFYTNPLWVALALWAFNRERLSARQIAAVGLGFAGVALAVQVSWQGADWRGLALAAYAGIGVAGTVAASQRLLRAMGSLSITMHVNMVAALVYVGVAWLHGFAFPSGGTGWFAFAVMPFSFALGAAGYFAAIGRIGGMKTSTIMNAEPVFTVLAAIIVLGERLASLQLAGAMLVLASIILIARRSRPA